MRNPRLVAAVLCAAAGFAFQWAIVRANYGGNWTALFCHGSLYPVPAGLAFEHIYVFPDSGGYDGQSYHYVAHDPLRRSDIGRAVPDPGRRFPRILVPGLAWLLALGRAQWIDASLFAVNLWFLGLGVYWLAWLLPRPGWAALYLLTPVVLISLDRMTIDLALASLTFGFVMYTRQGSGAKLWVVLAAAALCRESGFLLFAAYAWMLAAQGRYRRIAWFATALIPAIAWNLWSGASSAGSTLVPFSGIVDAILHPRTYHFGTPANGAIQAVQAVQFAGLLLGIGLAFRGVRKAGADPLRNACLLFAVFGICLPTGAYDDPFGGARLLAPLLFLEFLSAEPWGRLPLAMCAPRVWLELAPQVLRAAGWHLLRFGGGLLLMALVLSAQAPAENAQSRLDAAQAALAAGDYARAFEQASAAASLFHRQNDSAGESTALNTAGSAQLRRGQYEAALDLYRDALALDRRRQDAAGEITRMGNIGNVFFFQGRYPDALENYRAAVRRAVESNSPAWSALTNLAILYQQLGRDQEALDCYRQALANPGGIAAAERGRVLSSLGALYRRMGDGAHALATYDEAAAAFAGEPHSEGAIHAREQAGVVLALDLGDAAGAGRAFDGALKSAQSSGSGREMARALLLRGEWQFRGGDMDGAGSDFEAALDGARAAGDGDAQWTALHGLARIARGRGDTVGGLARLREAIQVMESARSVAAEPSLEPGFLAARRDVYDAAIGILLESPQRDTAQLFRWIELAHAPNFRDALRGLTPPPLAAVQGRLPEGGALVEYWIGEGRLAALWVTRGGAGTVDRRWSAADNSAALALADTLGTAAGSSWRAPAAALAARLVQGIPLESVRRLIFVPDGVLYRLPFEVLPMDAAETLLIERMPVSYLPTASLLFREPAPRAALAPWRAQVAAFGNPAGELREIFRALPGRARVYTGREDLKRFLFDGSLGGVPILHFAARAGIDARDSNRSRIGFAPEAGSAGAAWLYRAEAQALRLEGTDLVTLPAIEMAGGSRGHDEAVQAFGRTFLAAGAGAAVTPLWRVEEGAVQDFARRFYASLGRGSSFAGALRDAKLGLLHQGGVQALPRNWAGFVLNGDGDSVARPVLSWLRVGLIAAVLALVVGGYLRFRWRRR